MTIPYGETSFTVLKEIYKTRIKETGAVNAAAIMLDGISLMSDLRAAILECRKIGSPIYVMLMLTANCLRRMKCPPMRLS